MTKAFRIEVGGFNNTFATLPEVAAWVADLKAQFPWIIGKTATIFQGEMHKSVVSFSANCPRKVLVVSA